MAKKKSSSKKFFTITQAAERLGVSRAAVHLAIKKGRLPATWGTIEARALLISSRDLESYQVDIERQRSGKKT